MSFRTWQGVVLWTVVGLASTANAGHLLELVETESTIVANETKLVLTIPELIARPSSSIALKSGFAVGLTEDSPDWGVRTGVSVLF